jgi:putative flippase GtrA
LGRFLLVGALGTLIDVGLFSLFHLRLGLPVLLANTLSYTAGMINNFSLDRAWAFADQPRKQAALQFAQFTLVSLSALALNDLVVGVLTPPLTARLNGAGAGALLAKVCATAVGLLWNFAGSSRWVFKGRSQANGSV